MHDRRIPPTRGLEPQLRRNRLLAARTYAAGSVPRLAIMLGHWDAGEVVLSAGASLERDHDGNAPAKRRRRRKV